MRRHLIPEVFEIPDAREAKPAPWLAALAMTAIIVGATVALVAINYAPDTDPQVTVSR
jgi:hypothetical protein